MRVGADLALVPRTPLRLYLAHRRQGEGDYRETYPQPAQYSSTPGIFSGVVMGVTRVGLSGASSWRDFELSGDLGVNHNTNDAHIPGVSRTAFEGRLKKYRAALERFVLTEVDTFVRGALSSVG